MLLFGSVDNPFSSNHIDDEYLYIKKLFSKKINSHLVELLNCLNSSAYKEWKISNVENIDNMFDPNGKQRSINKEAVYRNYKTFLVDTRKVNKENIETISSLKTLLLIDNDTEAKQKDLNYTLFDILAEHIMDDLEITADEISLADSLCDILAIARSEFISVLHNKSSGIMSNILATTAYKSIKHEEIEKIQNYYQFLNSKSLKYNVDLPLTFLNRYNTYCYENKIDLIGIKLDVGFPTMIDYPIYGAYDGKVSKMKKISGQNTFEQNPARIYNYMAGFTIAYKYHNLDSFNGAVDTMLCPEIKEFGNRVFSNTGEKYLSVQKKGERNPFAFSDLKDVEYSIIIATINYGKEAMIIEEKARNQKNYEQEQHIDNNNSEKPSQIQNDPEETTELNKNETEDYVAELNKLIGLNEVKAQINSIANYIKIQKLRSSRELKTTNITLHSVFSGSPWTGKTTVARLYGGILKQLGVLKKGHLIEVDRSGLVAGYLGQTAIKVDEAVTRALDGILFIDEAYSLTGSQNDSFGEEAVNTLVKKMEDNRERLVVILAGYTSDMENFIESNPGLKSRFSRYIKFDDYSTIELYGIFDLLCKENEYRLTDEATKEIKNHFDMIASTSKQNFGNGRYVRNIFEKIVERHSNRIVNLLQPTDEDMITFSREDVKV